MRSAGRSQPPPRPASRSRGSAPTGIATPPTFPPLDVIDALEARTVGTPGHPHVTQWLARRRGYELVKLPDPSAPPMSWSALLSETIKASGELAGRILGDLSAAGEISPSQAWLRLKDAGELVRVAVELEASLKARAAEGRGG
jgi:hypothetical protein